MDQAATCCSKEPESENLSIVTIYLNASKFTWCKLPTTSLFSDGNALMGLF